MRTLKDIKRGDSVIVIGRAGSRSLATVTKAGPAWITIGRTRYHRCDGRVEGGTGIHQIEPEQPFVPPMGEEIHAELREDEVPRFTHVVTVHVVTSERTSEKVMTLVEAWLQNPVATGAFERVKAVSARRQIFDLTTDEKSPAGGE